MNEPRRPTSDPHATGESRQPRSRFFPWGTRSFGGILAVIGLAIVAVLLLSERIEETFPRWDGQVAQIVAMALTALAILVIVIWLGIASWWSWGARIGLALVALAGCGGVTTAIALGLLGLIRLQFSGDMRPDIVLIRNRPMPSAPTPADPDGEAVDVTPTASDYARFLGPEGDAVVESFTIADDWVATPPEPLWRQPIGEGWSAFSVVGEAAFTLEQRDETELVTCYRLADGALVWSHGEATRHGPDPLGGDGPRSTPTVHEGRVYSLGGTGRLLCLDAANGAVLWRHDLFELLNLSQSEQVSVVAWGRSASPLIMDGLCVVPGGGPRQGPSVSLLAFDAQTGEPRWRGGTSQISYATPIVTTRSGVRQIVSVNEADVTGHDPADGRVLWQFPWPGSSAGDATVSQPLPFEDDKLLVSKGYGGGAKLVRLLPPDQSGTEDWEVAPVWENRRAFKTKFSSVVPGDGGHGFALSDGILQAVDLTDGRIIERRGRYGHGQMLRVADRLVILSEDGDLVLVRADPTNLEELSRVPVLEGKTWNHLALAGDRLLVRNSDEAACYRLPRRDVPSDRPE